MFIHRHSCDSPCKAAHKLLRLVLVAAVLSSCPYRSRCLRLVLVVAVARALSLQLPCPPTPGTHKGGAGCRGSSSERTAACGASQPHLFPAHRQRLEEEEALDPSVHGRHPTAHCCPARPCSIALRLLVAHPYRCCSTSYSPRILSHQCAPRLGRKLLIQACLRINRMRRQSRKRSHF